MSREDYDEIKKNFEVFVSAIKTRQIECLKDILVPDVTCYLSCARAYADGSQHTLFGIKNFILDMPQTDFFHTRICNYICRIENQHAQQYAHVVCQVGRYGEPEPQVFLFDIMVSNHWKKVDACWMMDEIRMDIVPDENSFDEFFNHWHFEDAKVIKTIGVHLPCISGELDSPWYRIQNSEDILTEEEKVAKVFYRYAFGIDHLVFHEVEQCICEDVVADIQPWGSMDKRTWLSSLKFHRQKDRHWYHCGKIADIKIQKDLAYMKIYRMCGHKQREHPYQYTNENVDMEHACAYYEIVTKKTQGEWKIKKCTYYLGLIELGIYCDEMKVNI